MLAGGIESMSRMPYLVDSADARWGHKMGHFPLVDAMYRDGFQDPLSGLIMGETAEILARQYGITREQSDQFALESQQKAEAAQKAGYFTREIAPVTDHRHAASRRVVDSDEHPRHGTTLEALAKLPPVFPKVEGHPGIITAGSSSGITDGGAALVARVGSVGCRSQPDAAGADRGLGECRRRSAPHGHRSGAGDRRNSASGIGLELSYFDLVELNEAFARAGARRAQGRADSAREAERQRRRHRARPSHRLHRRAHRRDAAARAAAPQGVQCGLATLCVSGGMGMAMAVEV